MNDNNLNTHDVSGQEGGCSTSYQNGALLHFNGRLPKMANKRDWETVLNVFKKHRMWKPTNKRANKMCTQSLQKMAKSKRDNVL